MNQNAEAEKQGSMGTGLDLLQRLAGGVGCQG